MVPLPSRSFDPFVLPDIAGVRSQPLKPKPKSQLGVRPASRLRRLQKGITPLTITPSPGVPEDQQRSCSAIWLAQHIGSSAVLRGTFDRRLVNERAAQAAQAHLRRLAKSNSSERGRTEAQMWKTRQQQQRLCRAQKSEEIPQSTDGDSSPDEVEWSPMSPGMNPCRRRSSCAIDTSVNRPAPPPPSRRLRRLGKQRRRLAKAARCKQAAVHAALQPAEREQLSRVFGRFSDCGVLLHSDKLFICLSALGLGGESFKERCAIRELCDGSFDSDVDMHVLVTQVIPRARASLLEIQQPHTEDLFARLADSFNASGAALDVATRLTRAQCIAGLEFWLGGYCPVIAEDVDQLNRFVAEQLEIREANDGIDREAFSSLAQMVRETASRLRHQRFLHIASERNMDSPFLSDLIGIQEWFQLLQVEDGMGAASGPDLRALFVHLGLAPLWPSRRDCEALERIFWDTSRIAIEAHEEERSSGGLNFAGAVAVVQKLQESVLRWTTTWLSRELRCQDREPSDAVGAALALLCVKPLTTAERFELHEQMREATGSPAEVAVVAMRHLLRNRRSAELRLANALGLGNDLRVLRESFGQLADREGAVTLRDSLCMGTASSPCASAPGSAVTTSGATAYRPSVATHLGVAQATASVAPGNTTAVNSQAVAAPARQPGGGRAALGDQAYLHGAAGLRKWLVELGQKTAMPAAKVLAQNAGTDFNGAMLAFALTKFAAHQLSLQGQEFRTRGCVGIVATKKSVFPGKCDIILAALGFGGPLTQRLPQHDREGLTQGAIDVMANQMDDDFPDNDVELLVHHCRAWARSYGFD